MRHNKVITICQILLKINFSLRYQQLLFILFTCLFNASTLQASPDQLQNNVDDTEAITLLTHLDEQPNIQTSNIYHIPVMDHYSIVATLKLNEVCITTAHFKNTHEPETTENNYIELKCHMETIIDVPVWALHLHKKYSSSSEIPVFNHIKTRGGKMSMSYFYPPNNNPQSEHRLEIRTPYFNKTFHTNPKNLPEWPEPLNNQGHELDALMLSLNPLMLKEFNTDSYIIFSWIDNLLGSGFEKQVVTISDYSDNTIKLKVGEHHSMAMVFDPYTNKPEAILLDDAQGATLRNIYFFASPLVYVSNLHEISHHFYKALKYGTLVFARGAVNFGTRVLQAINSMRNCIELTEHSAHVAMATKNAMSAYGNETSIEQDNDYEPNYWVGSLDVFNLLCTVGEFIYEWSDLTPLGIADNTIATTTGAVNLLVSSNPKTLIEPYENRVDLMVWDWRNTFKDKFKEHLQKKSL